jgi:hypothetical protein
MKNHPSLLPVPTQDIADLLRSIEGISPLRFDDEPFLRQSFPKGTVQYAHSFLYLLRASHGDSGTPGYKFVSRDLIAVIGHRHNCIYITLVADRTKGRALQHLCQTISARIEGPIYLKKFAQDISPYMQNISMQPVQEGDLEDDTCSETIVTLPKLFLTPQGEINPAAKRFRKAVKRFEKAGIQFNILDDMTQVPQSAIERFLKKDSEKYANDFPMIAYLYAHGKDTRYKTMVFLHKKTVQGLYIVDTLFPKAVGLYCAITAKDTPGITEWMDWYFFRHMLLEGIQTIYFGGAETAGVDYYIKKLLPDRPPYSVTTVYATT